MKDPTVFPARPRVAVPCAAILGEAPIWDGRTKTLFFVDIKSCTVFEWRPAEEAEPRRHVLPDQVGFVQLLPNARRVVVGLKPGLAVLDLDTGKAELTHPVEPDRPNNRLNDAGVSPNGALFFGSMDDDEEEPLGSFYHFTGGEKRRFGEHGAVLNGPTFDPSRRLVYTADTQNGLVYRHRLAADGSPGEGELLITFPEGWGHPDGITIDGEGHLWIAHFGGGRVTRFTPDGEPVLAVPVPTAKVTKVGFGGWDLGTMYITTAAIGQDRETDLLAGHLFAVETGHRGIASEIVRTPAW